MLYALGAAGCFSRRADPVIRVDRWPEGRPDSMTAPIMNFRLSMAFGYRQLLPPSSDLEAKDYGSTETRRPELSTVPQPPTPAGGRERCGVVRLPPLPRSRRPSEYHTTRIPPPTLSTSFFQHGTISGAMTRSASPCTEGRLGRCRPVGAITALRTRRMIPWRLPSRKTRHMSFG